METIDFASDEPNVELLPLEELADCAATVLANDGKAILSYGSGAGYTPLRELIGEWFGVHPFRVVITSGWLQGFALLASRLVPGRAAAVEYPADERTVNTLLGAGGSLLYVVGDDEGLLTSDLEQQLIQYAHPTLIVVNPDFSSPTGRVMSLDRRRHLVELLARFNGLRTEEMLLLEDGSYELTRYEGERVPGLFEVSRRRTIFSSSFSATIAPGLRTGWLILPDELAPVIAQAANSTYITAPLLGQATAFEFIRRGSFEPHLAHVRETLRARRDAMLAALAEHLPGARWSTPEGGYFVWLELPSEIDGRAVLERAKGVTALDGTRFAVTSNLLRLSYSATGVDEIPIGIERLGAAVAV